MTAPVPHAPLSDAKADILDRIRGALAESPPERVVVDRSYRRTRPEGTDVVRRFADRLADYKALVSRADGEALIDTAAGMLTQAGVDRVVVPPGGRLGWLAATGVEIVYDDPPLSIARLDEVNAVVSGCALAIAETGTIVLDTGPDQGRRALTLVPDYHLCVVRIDQIVGTVPEAVARLDPRRPLTWISGPSATSDIEMDRVEGVHGPRTLHVLLAG